MALRKLIHTKLKKAKKHKKYSSKYQEKLYCITKTQKISVYIQRAQKNYFLICEHVIRAPSTQIMHKLTINSDKRHKTDGSNSLFSLVVKHSATAEAKLVSRNLEIVHRRKTMETSELTNL